MKAFGKAIALLAMAFAVAFCLAACGGGSGIDGTYYDEDHNNWMKISGNGTKCTVGNEFFEDGIEIEVKYDSSKKILTANGFGEETKYQLDTESDPATLTEMDTDDPAVYYKEAENESGEKDKEESKEDEEEETAVDGDTQEVELNEITYNIPSGFELSEDDSTDSYLKYEYTDEEGGSSSIFAEFYEMDEPMYFSNKEDVDTAVNSILDGEIMKNEKNREEHSLDTGHTDIITDFTVENDSAEADGSMILINDADGNVYSIITMGSAYDPRELAESIYESMSYPFDENA